MSEPKIRQHAIIKQMRANRAPGTSDYGIKLARAAMKNADKNRDKRIDRDEALAAAKAMVDGDAFKSVGTRGLRRVVADQMATAFIQLASPKHTTQEGLPLNQMHDLTAGEPLHRYAARPLLAADSDGDLRIDFDDGEKELDDLAEGLLDIEYDAADQYLSRLHYLNARVDVAMYRILFGLARRRNQ